MDLFKCLSCNGKLSTRLITWEDYVEGKKISIPDMPAAVCENCGKKYISDDAAKLIEEEKKRILSTDGLIVRLKEIRTAKGLTQAEIARRMGFTVARYSDIENNRKKPNILLALKLARALECDINDIYSLVD